MANRIAQNNQEMPRIDSGDNFPQCFAAFRHELNSGLDHPVQDFGNVFVGKSHIVDVQVEGGLGDAFVTEVDKKLVADSVGFGDVLFAMIVVELFELHHLIDPPIDWGK